MEYNLLIANYKKYSKRETEINQEITQIKVKIKKINEQIINFGVENFLNNLFAKNIQNSTNQLNENSALADLKKEKSALLSTLRELEKEIKNQNYITKIEPNSKIESTFLPVPSHLITIFYNAFKIR